MVRIKMILVVVLYAVLASTFILAKKAVSYAQPCFLIGFRMIIAGLILLSFQVVRHNKLKIQMSDLWLFFKTALFHIYFAFILEFWALQYVSALKTTLIYSTTPFIAALLSYLLLNERLSVQKIIGIIIGLGGLAPVLMATISKTETPLEFGTISLQEIALMTAVISAAYAWFLVKKLMNKGYSFSLINGVTMLMGGVLSLITSAVFEGLQQPVYAWGPFLGWILALILVANVVFYNMFGWLLQWYSITFITFSGFLCPGFGTLYEWLFMGGAISWHYLVSLVLVTLGLYIFYRQELAHLKIESLKKAHGPVTPES